MSDITGLDQLLLDALNATEWRSRGDIATHMTNGESFSLNQYDIKRLERLVASGLVERSERIDGKVKRTFIYRLRGAT